MARNFSSNDARRVIDEHKRLIDQLYSVCRLSDKYQADTKKAAKDLVAGGTFETRIPSSIANGYYGDDLFSAAERLILNIYIYCKLSPLTEYCKRLIDVYRGDIERSIEDLKPGSGGIRWMIASSQKKAKAAEAYDYLSERLSSSYPQMVMGMVSDAEKIKKTSGPDAWRDFEKNKTGYRISLLKLAPGSETLGGLIRAFSDVITEHEALKKKISDAKADVEKGRDRIFKAANAVILKEAMNILGGVPVEEVNREKIGIRTKLLRDGGFETMADIYNASSYKISEIKGIGDETARAVKRIAEEYVTESKKSAKIRLSADAKTKEATGLVCAIYSYKKMLKNIESLNELDRSNRSVINREASDLKGVGNGIVWLFLSESEREGHAAAYNHLTSLLDGEYAWSIKDLTSALSSDSSSFADDAWRDFERDTVAYYNILEDVVPGALGNDDSVYGLPEELAREIQNEGIFPEGLLCTLRRYQEWGVKYALHQERVLLGDEMGLGKTIQAIATMTSLCNTGATHFIVVCPASVITNWCREITKHSKLSVIKVHGTGRTEALKEWMKIGGVAVTTYETTVHFKLHEGFFFDMLVVDEAHYIKNPSARRTVNVKALCGHTKRLLFMTGTALENRVDEMIALIQILNPEIASQIKNMAFMSTAPQFREKVAPVYYRRKREDVLTELPDLIESREWCTLSKEEEEIYEQSLLSENFADIRRVSWNVEDLKSSSKAARLKELADEAKEEGRKVIVFSFYLKTIGKINEMLSDRCYGPINGSVSPQRRQEIIDEFDKAPAGSVLVSQIMAGGTGLNIQSASVVIICEPQLKPSTENQAISRAYRMGQSRNVLVYRLLCENTVDERIIEMLERKQAEFDAFADKSVAADESVALDEKTFGDIINEEIERIKSKRGKFSAGGSYEGEE